MRVRIVLTELSYRQDGCGTLIFTRSFLNLAERVLCRSITNNKSVQTNSDYDH
jgi:hypothetical protein